MRKPTKRRAAPIISMLVALLAGLSVLANIALIDRAASSRDAQHQVDGVKIAVDVLQGVPWELVTPGENHLAAVEGQIAGLEHAALGPVAALQRKNNIPELAALPALLQRNFGVDAQLVRLLHAGGVNQSGPLGGQQFATSGAALAVLDRAGAAYSAASSDALTESMVGSGLVVLLLVGAFTVFYWRASVARRRAEELAATLRISESHLQQAQRVSGVGSWEWTRGGRTSWSPEQARLHGWTRPESPSSFDEILALIVPEDRERVRDTVMSTAETGQEINLQYRIDGPGGERVLDVQGAPLTGADGEVLGLIGTSQDITDRLRRVEAERANEAKTEFISRMSHELRTPLNSILGFGQLLATSDLDEHQRGNVDHVLTAGRHLLDLINEILDLSRVESGQLRLAEQPVNVTSAIEEAVEFVLPLAAARGITVTAEPASDAKWVLADPQRLRQVLLNLLSNAVKYNDEDGHVTVQAVRATPERVRVSVIDDGPGLDQSVLDRLFSPFERLGAERTTVDGTGLGLAVSKGLTEAMGGEISAETELGRGSTFTVELSVAEPPATEQPVQPLGPGFTVSDLACRVLCIEDNPTNLAMVEQILTARPEVELVKATTGRDGIRLAHEQAPELVLLDLGLPDIDGGEVLAQLRSDAATERTAVVVVTADGTPERREATLTLGAQAYLTKPIDIPELLRVVDTVIAGPAERA